MGTRIILFLFSLLSFIIVDSICALEPDKPVSGKYDCDNYRSMATRGRLPAERAEALRALEYCDSTEDLDILFKAVQSGNKRERLSALSSIAFRADGITVDRILPYYNHNIDPEEDVLFYHIFQILASPENGQRLETIFLRGSTADNPGIRIESLLGLRKINSSRRLNGVIKALQSEDKSLITAGLEGASGFEDPELYVLTDSLLKSDSPDIQKATIQYYATLKSERTLKSLVRLEKEGIHSSNAPFLWDIAEKRIEETFPGTVPALTRQHIRIYTEPRFQSEVVRVLGKNDVVFVAIPVQPIASSIPEDHLEPDEWVLIHAGDGLQGWCRRSELTIYEKNR